MPETHSYVNRITGEIVGPFLAGSFDDIMYGQQSAVWSITANVGGFDGGFGGGGFGPGNPNPNPGPPAGDPNFGPHTFPNNDPTGLVIETFVDNWNHKGAIVPTYMGSNEWKYMESDHVKYTPNFRATVTFQTPPIDTWSGYCTRFQLKGDRAIGVPRSSFLNGYYDCDNLGSFAGSSAAEADSFYANCKGVKPTPDQTPTPEPDDTSCGFYDCPSHSGGECCHDTRPALKAIADAINELTLKLVSGTKDSCDISDKCIDEITDKVLKRLAPVKKTCKECCADIRNGISMSSEDAFRCSQMECNCAEQECHIGSQGTTGGPCTTCNKEPCCCKNGSCLPCDEQEPDKEWFAYCSPVSGLTYVSRTKGAPSDDFTYVGSFESESLANARAAYVCRPKPPDTTDTSLPQPSSPPYATSSAVCELMAFATPESASNVSAQFADEQVATYARDVYLQLIQSLDTSTSWVPGVGALVGALRASVMAKPSLALQFAPTIVGLMGCQGAEARLTAGAIGAAATVSEYTGVNVLEYAPHLSYALHATCRNRQLSASDAITTWLGGVMDENELDANFAIEGYCPKAVERTKFAARKKLDPLQLAVLRHREVIDKQEYNTRMRTLGFIDEYEREQAFELTNQVPNPSDIIRMMVRDADDTKIAETFHTDDGFTEKYGKQLKKWAKDQGMPDLAMQYLWRSHWSIPAPGQLFTMYQRLRHDKTFNGDGKLLEKIKLALVQQDILPYWQDSLIAIAFRPLSRVDVRRAFEIGAIDEDGVRKSYWDQGYDDDNADRLVKFAKKLRERNAANHPKVKLWKRWGINRGGAEADMVADGYPQDVVTSAFKTASLDFAGSYPVKAFLAGDMEIGKVRTALQEHGVDANAIETIMSVAAFGVKRHSSVSDYTGGIVERDTALAKMVDYGIAEDKAKRLLDAIDSKLIATMALSCQHSVKQRFLLGEFNAEQATGQLIKNSITKERAEKLVDWWDCEKSAIGKAVPAVTLCDWLSQGVLSPINFMKRLRNIGHTVDDASQMLVDCKGKINAKQAADALKQAKAEAAQIAKQQKQQQMQQAALEKQVNQIKRAAAMAKAARLRRITQLEKAVEKLYKKGEWELSTISTLVKQNYDGIESAFALNADETLQALLQASEAFSGDNLEDYTKLADGFAQSIVNKALEPDELPLG